MKPEDVKTVADAKKIVNERKLTHLKVGVFDIDGVLRGKYMSREKFFSSLDKGFGFCDVVLGWDSNDQMYDNTEFTGWHTGYPDAQVRILPETCRDIPFEPGMLFFLAEFTEEAKAPCPRGVLRRVLDKAHKMGFEVYAGFEYEYFIFDETPDSVRAKHYRDLKPMAPGYFGYSVIRNTVHSGYYNETLELCEQMRFPLEALHEETGPGVLEAAIAVDEGLSAADKAGLFKTFIKVHAQLNGRMATFMAKWNPNLPGQSGHIHVSLTTKAGKPVFHDPKGPLFMSKLMQHFVA
ncbi:MAG: glutamine synthetase, partial [Prolixibacteraceae bacterium]|nr:glutamine synthetase [Burkholderiales bacterium]